MSFLKNEGKYTQHGGCIGTINNNSIYPKGVFCYLVSLHVQCFHDQWMKATEK